MRVRIAVEQDEGAGEAQSLYKWLSRDPDVLGSVGLSLTQREDQAPGRMGPDLDMIDVVFDDVVQLASLVVAVATWRGTRPRAHRVRIERGDTVVTLESDDPAAVRHVLGALSDHPRNRAGGDSGEPSDPTLPE